MGIRVVTRILIRPFLYGRDVFYLLIYITNVYEQGLPPAGIIYFLRKALKKRQHLDFSSVSEEKSLVLLRFSRSESVPANEISYFTV